MTKSLYDKNGEYAFLPNELRDFHEQKDLFKDLFDYYKDWVKTVPDHMNENLRNINWCDLHILMTDFLLHQMAQRGYVLRKCNKFVTYKENTEETV